MSPYQLTHHLGMGAQLVINFEAKRGLTTVLLQFWSKLWTDYRAITTLKQIVDWLQCHYNFEANCGLTTVPLQLWSKLWTDYRAITAVLTFCFILAYWLFVLSDIKFIRNLINSQPLKDWEFYFDSNLMENCAQYGNWTTAYIDCFIRQIVIPAGSPVGTCRMGAQGDPSAVVDPFLRSVINSRRSL